MEIAKLTKIANLPKQWKWRSCIENIVKKNISHDNVILSNEI